MKNSVAIQIRFVAAYVYLLATSFLYYVTLVQFGLMHHFEQTLQMPPFRIFAAIGAMAIFGIFGGIAAGGILDRKTPRMQGLLAAIGACSLFGFGLAFLCLEAGSFPAVIATMAGLGANLGVLIVVLLYGLNRFVHMRIRGFFSGFAVALSYLAANIIAAVTDDPALIASINAFAIGSNILIIPLIWEMAESAERQPFPQKSPSAGSILSALLPLTLLVFLDTYTFYPIGQESFGPYPVLLIPEHWIRNGIWHALLAILAGIFAFSMGNRRFLQIGFVAIIVAAGLLFANHFDSRRDLIHPAYSLCIAVYTIVLFTIWGWVLPEKKPGLWLGLGLALCGWIGSGAGIATSIFAQRVLPLPYLFVPAILIAPIGLWLLRQKGIFLDFADQVRRTKPDPTQSHDPKG